MRESTQKVFKGVWIPAEIWEDQRLTWFQKCLWAEISALGKTDDPCWCTNDHLAEVMSSTKGVVANEISELRKMGLVKDVGTKDRRALLAVISDLPTLGGVHPGVKGGSPRGEGGFTQGLIPPPSGNICRGTPLDGGRDGPENSPAAQLLRSAIGKAMNRDFLLRPLTYIESPQFYQICRRPSALEELKLIMSLRARRHHPPESVLSLLSKWDHFLERASNLPKKYAPNI